MATDARIETTSWGLTAIGLATIALPFAAGDAGPVFASALASGAILLACGAYVAWDAARHRARGVAWPTAVALLVGVWVAIFPWWVATSDAFRYGSLLLGAVAIGLGAFGLFVGRAPRPRGPQRPAY